MIQFDKRMFFRWVERNHQLENLSASCAALVDSQDKIYRIIREFPRCAGFSVSSPKILLLTEEADFQRLCAEADELLDSASSGNVAMAEKRLVGADQVAVLWVAVGLMAEVGSPNKGV